MRILQVSSARFFGGGERHLADLTCGLAARGHEVFAALRRVSALHKRLDGVPSKRIVTLAPRNALDLPSGLNLARFLRDNRIDIIHAHLARDYPVAALAARRAGGARLVLTRHVLFPLSRLHGAALSNVSRVIAVSEAVARSLRAQGIFDSETIRVVANAIDIDRFASARTLRVSTGRPLRVGIVGELSELKDQESFLRAAAIVVGQFGANVEFLIVGADSSAGAQYQARVEKLIAELALFPFVRLLGQRGDDEIPGILASLDVLVSASHSESFGMAMAEAMASGVPVVATATDGARQIVEDGVTGLITSIGDHQALAIAILSLLGDEGCRAAFAERAAVRARERFSLDRMVTETERIYEEAISGTVSPNPGTSAMMLGL